MTGVAEVLRPVFEARSYLAFLYGVMRFPLALTYLVALTILIATGFALAFVGVGLAILFLAILVVWLIAIFERELGAWWFGFELSPLSVPAPVAQTLWRRALGLVVNPLTWKALAFVLVEVIAGFTVPFLLLGLASAAVGLLASPLVALLDSFSAAPVPGSGIGLAEGLGLLGLAVPEGYLLAASVLAGAVAAVLCLHLANIYVESQRFLVRVLLGLSESEVKVAAARREAAVQQQRADRSEQSRRELVVNASHELRTPVASIRGHVEALLDRPDIPDGDARRYLDVVHRETERLGALVDDLVAVARAEAGELRLDVRPTDVGEVANRVAAALAPMAERDRHVKLVNRVDSGLPLAWADRDRLDQVLLNLVRNAITYTPEGGLVAIEAEESGPEHVVVTVADTGIGLEPAELERVFDRFYRTDASRSRATGGFGLGLSISRELVTAMGGSIDVSSTPGEGSRFAVRLRKAA